jgi:penicillin G amidase
MTRFWGILPSMRRPAALLVILAMASATLPVANAQTPTDQAPFDSPPPQAGQAVSLLAPGNSGFVSLAGQAEGSAGGSYGDNLDDQSALYWGLEGYAGQGFADPADAVRVDTPVDGVRIYWDEFGVPAIYGDTGRDVWFGAGYSIAQIRLFLMDAVRRLGRGTFAELVGPAGVPDDVQTRVLTFGDAEYQAMFDELSDEAKDAVEGYVDGANAWIDEAMADPDLLPAEYALLTTTPEPLDVIDVLAAGVLITRSVASEGGNEMSNVAALRELEAQLGQEEGRGAFADLVWNDDPAAVTSVPIEEGVFANQPVTDEAAALDAAADFAATIPLELASGSGTGAHPEPTSGVELPIGVPLAGANAPTDAGAEIAEEVRFQLGLGLDTLRGGSVAAAIGPGRTADGGALLLSGPQLGYSYPSLLVELEVHGGGYDARGASVPALPTVGIGYTDTVAWALTTGFSKTIDSFIETVRDNPTDGGPLQYEHDGQWKDADCRDESVAFREAVMGVPVGPAARSEDIVVCRTVHGPIVAEQAPVEGQETRLARSVQYHMFGRELETVEGILQWNRASTFEEFEAAMRLVTWNENTTYADADGRIAYWHPGLHLARPLDGDLRFPLPGDGSMDLGDPLPFESLPQVVDPLQGYVTNWNNKPAVGWFDGVGFGFASRPGGPVQRVTNVNEMIESRDDHTFTTLQDIEVDAGLVDPRAGAFLPLIAAALEGSSGQPAEVADLLAGWNRRHFDPPAAPDTFNGPGGESVDGTDGPAATIFDAIVAALVDEVLGDLPADIVRRQVRGGSHIYDQFPAHSLVQRVLDPNTSALGVSRAYLGGRTADEVIRLAVDSALAGLAEAFDSTDLADYRRPTAQSTVANLTGAIGPSATQPYQDRGTYIHMVGFDPVADLVVERAAGPERVATSVDASRRAFPAGADAVVLAAATTFPDSLTAAPLASAVDAPLLLVDEVVADELLAEVARLGATAAIVVGGEAAVSEAAVDQLVEAGLVVERVAGPNRFATAAEVAAAVVDRSGQGGPGPDAYIASGTGFADALSIGGVAARTGTPILLVEADAVPAETASALSTLGVASTVVVGGVSAVSDAVVADLPDPARVAGSDRYETAASVLRHARSIGLPFEALVIATGEDFPDGLTAGAVAGAVDGVVVLVRGLQPDDPGPALDVASSQRAVVRRVLLMGGTSVMAPAYETAVR